MLKSSYFISFFLVLTLCLFPQIGKEEASGTNQNYSNNSIDCTFSAEAEFPFELNFNLSAKSDVNIADIRLHYTVDRESYAQVTSEVFIEFVPDTAVDVSWDWDMRRTGGLPPGSGLEYWWTVKDVEGNEVETAPTRLQFDDNRYSWQSLTEGEITIYWYEGGQSFAGEVMLAVQQALARLAEDSGAHLKRPVRIFVYADSRDLQGAMIFPQEWTGGVAFTRYGIIAIGIAPQNLSWGRRAIAHELTHQVIHQMTFNPYTDLPTWLEEGLAMYAEGGLEAGFDELLERAVHEEQLTLISVRSLASPFSADPIKALLSYAQSYSLIEFLVADYGQDKMFKLLNAFSQGAGYDEALDSVYGFDMDGLNELWRDYVAEQYREDEAARTAMLPVPAGVQSAGGWVGR